MIDPLGEVFERVAMGTTRAFDPTSGKTIVKRGILLEEPQVEAVAAANVQEVRIRSAPEVGEVTMRIWIVYLAACSIVFQRNSCGLYQTLASKRVKGPVGLPPTRADLYR